jgi:SAM-dependent methyltransferase
MTADRFGALAPGYDAEFTDSVSGRALRATVWHHLADLFQPGQRLLELGCGTGEDALWLARRGLRVLATDSSPGMLEVARGKLVAAGVIDSVELLRLDLGRLDREPTPPGAPFDGALSDFGALNCLRDRRPVASALAAWLRPGARLATVVMGPVCAWEVLWHLLRARPRTAFRRLRRRVSAHLGDGRAIPVWYPSPSTLARELRPQFRRVRLAGVGVLVPPPYLEHLARRHPRLVARLAELDRRHGHRFPAPWLADHHLSVFERRPSPE